MSRKKGYCRSGLFLIIYHSTVFGFMNMVVFCLKTNALFPFKSQLCFVQLVCSIDTYYSSRIDSMYKLLSLNCSLFYWSNESVNIWTHLIGFVIFLILGAYDNLILLPFYGASFWDHVIYTLCLTCFQVQCLHHFNIA